MSKGVGRRLTELRRSNAAGMHLLGAARNRDRSSRRRNAIAEYDDDIIYETFGAKLIEQYMETQRNLKAMITTLLLDCGECSVQDYRDCARGWYGIERNEALSIWADLLEAGYFKMTGAFTMALNRKDSNE